MKAIFALALLLGLGIMVGCGDDTTKKGTTKSTVTTTTPPAADTAKKAP